MRFALLLFAYPLMAQTQPDTQALVNEIRLLRQDLQTTAATIQRVQIVMYRLQAETALVTRTMQRLDDARAGCTRAQGQRKTTATQIEHAEEQLRNAQNPADRKRFEEILPQLKTTLEIWTNDEQQCHTREAEADSQFRTERAKLSDLEEQLDKLDKALRQ